MGGLEVLKRNIWICALFTIGVALFSGLCDVVRNYTSIELGETVA
jgi:ATP-binding cassette subfamily B protein